MKKKLLSILLALTMLATLFTTCGSNDSSAASAASSGVGNTQIATEAPKEVSAAETPAAETPASSAEASTQESVFEIPEVSYLQQTETLNIDRVVEIYQEVYDAYAA